MSKKTNPQKGPVAPHILMKKFQPFKPVSEKDLSQRLLPVPHLAAQ